MTDLSDLARRLPTMTDDEVRAERDRGDQDAADLCAGELELRDVAD